MSHFAEQFLGPVEEEEHAEEVEDDLGYYEDGVKRTLTDEQIAIFRHSEIETLIRDRRHADEAREDDYGSPSIEAAGSAIDERQCRSPATEHGEPVAEEGDLEDGELEADVSTTQTAAPQPPQSQNKKKNKRKSKNGKKGERPPQPKGFFKQSVKPDLRKRTWDKVDTGLDNLDYDEDTSVASRPNHTAQRRRISYDDD